MKRDKNIPLLDQWNLLDGQKKASFPRSRCFPTTEGFPFPAFCLLAALSLSLLLIIITGQQRFRM